MRNTLLQAIESGRQLHLKFVERLTDEDKATPGTFEHWSGKDTLGHSLFWIENLNIHIQQAMNGAPLTDYDDYNTHNAEDYPRKKPLSWPEMLDLLKNTFDTQTRLIQEFPINEADLLREDWEKWTGGRSLQRAVLGSVINHPVYHFNEYFLNRDRVEDMEIMVQAASDALAAYPPVQAVIAYNLACYYALHDQVDKAFPLLRDSFAKNESLREWSQQDTDLDSLRERPEYQALLVPDAAKDL